MIKDVSFNKLRKYKKYKDLYDTNSFEVKAALIGAFLISMLIVVAIKENTLENINNIFYTLTKDIGTALIGFLGFTVTGLAILTGVISKKEVQAVGRMNKIESLEKILLSFYLLGITTAFTIVGLFSFYIISFFNMDYYVKLVAIITFVFAYMVIFIVFYAVKLIGNCLEIFFIVNGVTLEGGQQRKDIKKVYNYYRLTALEKICLSKMKNEDLEEYMRTIEEQIEENEILKDELREMFRQHFNIK